jgi:trans-2-enoyl-CoA reductase
MPEINTKKTQIIVDQLHEQISEFDKHAFNFIASGNKAAAKRARLLVSPIKQTLKEFRAATLDAAKESHKPKVVKGKAEEGTKPKKKGRPKKSD